MYTVNGIVVGGELYHHGVLGMKWGKRQGPPYPLDASDHSAAERKAGYTKSIGGGRNEEAYDRNRRKIEKKQNKIAKKYDKKIARAERDRDKVMDARERNRQKIEAKYDKKLKKAEFDKADKIRAKKDAKLKDFDEGSKYIRGGEQKYVDVIKNYKDAKMSAVENKLYKKDPKYKQAIAEYVWQVSSDMFLNAGSSMTKLGYSIDIANPNKRRQFTLDPNAAQKKYDKKMAKQNRIKENVKKYNEMYNKASRTGDEATALKQKSDSKFKEAKSLYKSTGKNVIDRARNIKSNNTAEARKYNKAYEEASRLGDEAYEKKRASDSLFKESKRAYKSTGKTYVTRVANNIKYDPERKRRR